MQHTTINYKWPIYLFRSSVDIFEIIGNKFLKQINKSFETKILLT